MILSDVGIKAALAAQNIVIDPPPKDDQYGPTSLDLHIGDEIKAWNKDLVKQVGFSPTIKFSEFDYQQFSKAYLRDIPKTPEGFITLEPEAFILANTREKISLKRESKLAARVEGRSTCARLGFTVHISAPTIHAGWAGKITLEIKNFGPFHVVLRPNQDRICQLIFEGVDSLPSADVLTTFKDQESVTGAAGT